MTFVYLDDGFPDHEKVVRAGGDAAWLYVAALCWVNRTLTGGRIPKAVVPRLTDRKRPLALAARLVAERLWEDDGSDFLVHDYESWNRSAEAKRQARQDKARKAAEARWARERAPVEDAPSSPPSNAQASSEQCPTMPPHIGARAAPTPQPPPSVGTSSRDTGLLPPEPVREEGDEPKNRRSDAICEAAYAWLARYDFERTSRSGNITSPDGWMVRATQNRRSKHQVDAERLIAEHPEWTPEQLAKAVAGRDTNGAAGESTVAAAYELAKRNEAERCPVHGRLEPSDPLPDCRRCRAVVGAGR